MVFYTPHLLHVRFRTGLRVLSAVQYCIIIISTVYTEQIGKVSLCMSNSFASKHTVVPSNHNGTNTFNLTTVAYFASEQVNHIQRVLTHSNSTYNHMCNTTVNFKAFFFINAMAFLSFCIFILIFIRDRKYYGLLGCSPLMRDLRLSFVDNTSTSYMLL